MCVCVCVMTLLLKNKVIRQTAADFSLCFRDFQLTDLSEVVSFMSYRHFRSFFEVAAIFLHDELPHAPYAHVQAGMYMEHTVYASWRFSSLRYSRLQGSLLFCPDRSGGHDLLSRQS